MNNTKLPNDILLVIVALLQFVAALLNQTIPTDSYEWASYFGKFLGMSLSTLLVNHFFKLYGTLVVLVLFSISLIYS